MVLNFVYKGIFLKPNLIFNSKIFFNWNDFGSHKDPFERINQKMASKVKNSANFFIVKKSEYPLPKCLPDFPGYPGN